jgi:uncharacterized protein YdiU (UPF0061 family)
VLNTDNINITGESFDYGPWRFAPTWDPQFTAAYFDHAGLYSFGRQPEAIQWNLAQLAGCLALVTDAPALSELLQGWGERFHLALVAALLKRLGVQPRDADEDRALARLIVAELGRQEIGIDRFFFEWRAGSPPAGSNEELRRLLEPRLAPTTHPYWTAGAPCSLLIDEVEAVWSPIARDDDWSVFDAKIAAIRSMAEAMRPAA